ncbi:hypothetical protein H9Y04_36460 [Streptomyces sp. TRM66268-LWL]|uniref:Transposase n=1 Tax=Streptomyces polyasparticus TaxID=2767826 RepID=A0ABR7SRA5_9ACTN|nr:hypothetical protein [Streptomyces polyasparticus]MBC9718041.1 hypothetical protein [Streptomyces polyasparticus]
MFGRHKQDPVIDPVGWDLAGRFVVSDIVRTAGFRRPVLKGPLSVRVPKYIDGTAYFAPAVLVVRPDDTVQKYELHAAMDDQRLLATVTPDGAGRFLVADEHARTVGTVHRTAPALRTVQHSWWLQQPGHADIVARYHWAKGNGKDIARRGRETAGYVAGRLAESLLNSALGGEGGDQPGGRTPKPATWNSGDEVALTSATVEGIRSYMPQASWLDRRLLFALAVLREG